MDDNTTETQLAQAATATPTSAKPKKRRCRWLGGLFFGLLLMIVAGIGLLTTGKGQQWLISQVAKQLSQLDIGQVEGSLQQGLTLRDTRFQMDGVSVQAGKAEVQIGLDCLWDKRACLENLALRDVAVAVDTTKLPPAAPKNDEPLGEIQLPLPVSLKQVSLDHIQVDVDGLQVQLDHFHSGLAGEGKQITLSPTVLDGLRVTLPTSEDHAVENTPKKTKKSTEASPPAVDWAALKQQLSQPLLSPLEPITLPIHLAIPQLQAKNLQLFQRASAENGTDLALLQVSSLDLAAKSDTQSVTLTQLDLQTDKGNLRGQGQLTLDGDYPLAWQLHANAPELKAYGLPASEVDVDLSGALFGQTRLAVKTKGAVDAQLQGSVQLTAPKTPLQLDLESKQIQYPFLPEKGVEPLQLQNVKLHLAGDLLDYQLNTQLAMRGMGLPEGDLALKGRGGLTAFQLDDLSINALQGKANLAGNVDWAEGIAWQSQAALQQLNTKSLLPDWAAVLSGKLQTTGYAGRGKQGDQWAVTVSDMDLHGNLLQKNLQLKGALYADSQTLLNVPNATLIYGENQIGLQGTLGEKSDFRADIQAPNLHGLVPALKASVQGKVRVNGKISEPSVDLDLSAQNVSYDQFKLQQLTAKGKITTDNAIQGDLKLGLRQFQYGEIKLDNAELQANGGEAQHRLTLIAKGDPVGANLQISGKFDRLQQVWQGQLANVAVQTPVGEWRNDKAIQLTYHNKAIRADISAHCWRNPKVNVCFPQNFQAGKAGNVPFEIKQFDLASVQEYLAKETQISGSVNAKGTAAWFENKAPQVNVELLSNRLTVAQKIDYRTFPITLAPVKITANLAENNLKLNSVISIENNGRLSSELWVKDVAKTRALSGNLNLERLNLSLVRPLLNSGDSIDGELNARLTLGGVVQSPLLFGQLNLAGLKARSSMMPFDVTGGNLAVNFNGASSTLKGNVQTKESNLTLSGDANWQKLDAWHTRINAQANRFRVDIPSLAKVDVSPNIEVQATPKALLLSGNVDIPWARIAVEELPESAVSVSSDEVIMDGSAKQKGTAALLPKNLPQNGGGMAIKADIAVNIGNDVKLDAYGLKTDLYGTLKVRQGSKGLGLYGQVNLKNGTFASFGQDLVVRKGLISFTGLPSQPTLDIEAIRNPEAIEDANIVAGVKVTGIADSPDVKLFSSPAMAQDQILSYILTGRGLESSGEAGSGNSIAAALIGLSLSKSSKMVGGVGSAFGISDLNVTTAGIGDNTKVVVSGSLTPKFKVKYGVGIFAPLTELTLRYRLAPSLYLQWVSSINQALDLLYRFEFD